MRRAVRRLFPFVAAPALLAVFAVTAGDAVPVRNDGRHVAPPPAASRATPGAVYARVRTRGQPIAIVAHATALRSAPDGRRLAHIGTKTEFGSPRVLAVVDEQRGWFRVVATELGNGRTGWIPAASAKLEPDPWRVRADLSRRRVEVIKGKRVVRRFTVTIGSPSTPTPTGSFAVTDRLEMIGTGSVYGCCALALSGHQPHLPQGWGGGDRLAIHATGVPESIGGNTSVGCLRAANRNARWLITHVYLGTIVTIRP